MKMKKKAAIAAAVFAAAMNFSACDNYASYDPEENQNANAYGPPEIEEWEYDETNTENVSNDDTTRSEEETDTEIVSNDDTPQTEEETSYDPADNINEDVYGPPIDE